MMDIRRMADGSGWAPESLLIRDEEPEEGIEEVDIRRMVRGQRLKS